MQAAEDGVILALAKNESRILVTADTDFGALFAQSGESTPSTIIFRRGSHRTPERQLQLLLANLSAREESLRLGSLVVIDETRIRIRQLPMHGEKQPGS
jgi:predicted nuclease of predicted toxin-antitoxin system